ncbi:hypothetical protein ACFQ3N_12695 [Virgibacillus byunsanensis]|uniref:DUF1404 domain-containing protein n=1 Tax=Virgibacillus byunsanensis TaxID=570945 RepID=A0ABW3LMB9_9BACI
MLNEILLWMSLIAPWLSLFLMKTGAIKRFMPVAIFVTLLLMIIYEIAYTYDWWKLKEYILPWGYITHGSFAYGLFLVGTIWIFYFTYHNFKIYMITNIIIDAMFAFVFLPLTNWLGINELIKISNWGVYLIMLTLAVIIYLYQRWQEGIFKEDLN